MKKSLHKILSVSVLTLLSGIAGAQAQITDLGSFNNSGNGENPVAGLVLSPDGTTLYGATNQGGSASFGTVFSVPVTGGTITAIGNFNGNDGENAAGDPLLSGSTLYGTSQFGGAAPGNGGVWSVPVSGGTPTLVSGALGDDGNGTLPTGGLTLIGSTLYGTTQGGGANNSGTVFSMPITGGSGTPTNLASFNGTNGSSPDGSLTLSGSTFYGTTQTGGASGDGAIFSVPVAGGTITDLASFSGTNGNAPHGSLLLIGTTLYGTTQTGGANNDGEIFSIPVTGGAITVLASFNMTDGKGPFASLTLSEDGTTLYGTTNGGGANSNGTVFAVPVTGGTITDLASFNGSNGRSPKGDLVLSADGSTLYGTTDTGGTNNDGVVFSVPTAVPEPGSALLAAVGGLGLLLRRRRPNGA